MDKVAAYKEWIYKGEIEKTALNAAMKRVKSLMQSGRVDAPGRIDNILDKVERFPFLNKMNKLERAELVKSGLKGNKNLKYDEAMDTESNKSRYKLKQLYRSMTGKDAKYALDPKLNPTDQYGGLRRKLRANRAIYDRKKEAYSM